MVVMLMAASCPVSSEWNIGTKWHLCRDISTIS
jgi:hypothetical protein